MTEEYECPKCQRLVSVSITAGEWKTVRCPNCGHQVDVKVEDE